MIQCFIGRTLPCVRRWYAQVFTLLLISSLTASAQEDFKPKFGNIDKAALEMTAYPGDSTAEAVYLYDFGEVSFKYDTYRGFSMVMKCWARIKILKESALDRASVSIPFVDGSNVERRETIEEIRGSTYNLESGQVVGTPLDRKSIKRERPGEGRGMVNFSLPNVKKGSVIEYTYERTTPINVSDRPDPWSFQGSIPMKWSEFRITIPDYLVYNTHMSGYIPLDISEQERVPVNVGVTKLDGHGVAYRFAVKDSPAFVNEPYITTPSDYISKISFELSTIAVPGEMIKNYSQTWENVDKSLNDMSWFGGELRKSSHLKPARQEIAAASADPLERMNLAYAYIQQHMKWNGNNGLASADGVKKAFDNKQGNVSAINLSLISLLRELDIECNPVVLSTRSHGRVREQIPLMEIFNYVIASAEINGKEYLLDATQRYARPGMLPERALNGLGRLLPRSGRGRFIELKPQESDSKLEIVTASIDPDKGILKGSYNISYGGYEALRRREKYSTEPDDKYHVDLKSGLPEWKFENIVVKNEVESLADAVGVNCDFVFEDQNASEDLFYFNPVMTGGWKANPLKSSDRIYPLDLTTGISSSYIGNFSLPAGYVLVDPPKAEVILLPEKAGRFSYQVRQVENVIQVHSTLLVNRTNFSSEEYYDVKEFFERAVKKHSEPLVIRKSTASK